MNRHTTDCQHHSHDGHHHQHAPVNELSAPAPVLGERATKQRAAIRDVLVQEGRPMSPPEILEAAQKHVAKLGIATVYRNLKAMVEIGEIAPVPLPGERIFYEMAHKAGTHHHHFRCEQCGKVFDIDGCDEAFSNLLPAGFVMTAHDLTLSGVCATCNAAKKPSTKNKVAKSIHST